MSDVCHVRVTQQGDVQLVIKLREEILGDAVIHFTRNNWYSYVTIARPQINKAMEACKDMTLKYHANMKVVKALKRDNRKYSIHLLTYSLKGMVRMDLCIYLNEEEYKKLEDSVGEINQWIEDTGVPTCKRNVLKMYGWKITSAKKNEQNEYDIVKSEQPFYTKEDALMEGVHVQESALHDDKPTELKVVEEWLPAPNEMQFLQQMYLYLIYRACAYIAKEKCPGCKSELLPLSVQHKLTSVGCQPNDVVKNNFDVAKPLVMDKIIKDVFLSSWKKTSAVITEISVMTASGLTK